ncbi:MAG: gamma-glutamyltransferase [Anaerolineaceae bacterium]
MDLSFSSHRSPVYGSKGMVASSQPLATAAGLEILRTGGNAASAAVAVAAALNVTEPTSTGLGGDVFVLYYSAENKKVYALNGSGRAPLQLSLQKIKGDGLASLPPTHPYTITVPGACAAWVDFNNKFGNKNLNQVFEPAIDLAENGFPVSPITAYFWDLSATRLLSKSLNGSQLLINGHAPTPGQIFKNKGLAKTLRLIAKNGKEEFYQGEISRAIISVITESGGCMESVDLTNHTSTWEEPIFIEYQGKRIWECPPNGQGLAALLALNILKNFDIQNIPILSAERFHLEIEAMRLAFADAWFYIADPATNPAPLDRLLSDEYARQRSSLINVHKTLDHFEHGKPPATSDTVYFCVVDKNGNACSFINSNYMGFGTGIVPSGYGFSLQNRGHNFSLDPNHPNHLTPGKRPYHTIIPAMVTDPRDNNLIGPFGVMGGFMQPQGHMQVAISLFTDNLNPQDSLDLPRFCIEPKMDGQFIAFEDGIEDKTIHKLIEMGHQIRKISGMERAIFGRGQIILRDNDSGVCIAGSDPRADGCAMTL